MNPLPIDQLQSLLPPALLVLLPELLLGAAAILLLLGKTFTARADRAAVSLTVAAAGAASAVMLWQVSQIVAAGTYPTAVTKQDGSLWCTCMN